MPACRSSPVQIDVRGHHGWALPWSSPPAASPDGIPYVYLNGHPQYAAADERSKALAGRLIRLEERFAADLRPYL